jgi:UDP-sugar transporter A1/2/3
MQTGWTISSWVQVAVIPAGLYTIQNTAALMAYQNLDGVTFNVLNQTKTLSAALCCYLIMGRKQSSIQILSLFALFASALVIEKIIPLNFFSAGSAPSIEITRRHYTHGVVPVLLASFISGLAGAISQKNLQSASGCGKSGGRNPFLFSSELCVASILLLSLSLAFSKDGRMIREHGFFYSWTKETMIPIFTNAIGGIIVGLVTKYAGSVRKGFALIFGLLLTGVTQSILYKTPISSEEIVGGVIAAGSLWVHSKYPYRKSIAPPMNDKKNA